MCYFENVTAEAFNSGQQVLWVRHAYSEKKNNVAMFLSCAVFLPHAGFMARSTMDGAMLEPAECA